MVSYQVYGSQTLTELRDKLFCIADYTIKTDYSENPSAFDRNSFKVSSRALLFCELFSPAILSLYVSLFCICSNLFVSPRQHSSLLIMFSTKTSGILTVPSAG